MENKEATQRLQQVLKDVRVAMLTTVADDGMLQSRPMVVQDLEFDGDLWFFTTHESGKVHQVEHNSQVNVAFVDTRNNQYLSVSGTASLVNDHAKITELWSPAFEIYFPKGLADPNIILLKVSVASLAWWEGPTTFVGKVVGMVKAWIAKDPAPLGDSGATQV